MAIIGVKYAVLKHLMMVMLVETCSEMEIKLKRMQLKKIKVLPA
jgi:hypothetical protein